MKATEYSEEKRAELPPLLKAGDVFKSISKIEVKDGKYQGKPARIGTLSTDQGLKGTFSRVIIDTLTEFFEKHPGQTYDDSKVVKARSKETGQTYLTLEGI